MSTNLIYNRFFRETKDFYFDDMQFTFCRDLHTQQSDFQIYIPSWIDGNGRDAYTLPCNRIQSIYIEEIIQKLTTSIQNDQNLITKLSKNPAQEFLWKIPSEELFLKILNQLQMQLIETRPSIFRYYFSEFFSNVSTPNLVSDSLNCIFEVYTTDKLSWIIKLCDLKFPGKFHENIQFQSKSGQLEFVKHFCDRIEFLNGVFFTFDQNYGWSFPTLLDAINSIEIIQHEFLSLSSDASFSKNK